MNEFLEDPPELPPIVGREPSPETLVIRERQAAFMRVMDRLIAFYRALDTTPRAKLKPMLKDLREYLARLGETVCVSRHSLDSLWKG